MTDCSDDPQRVELSRDARGHLVLETSDGGRFVNVDPVRSFPITDPDRWIAFVDHDGNEVFCLETLESLPPASLALLKEELGFREFVPVVQRILRVIGDSTPSDWEVQTDRGPTRFTLDHEEDVRRLTETRILITDSRNLRYMIPDLRTLDARSRRTLDRFL